MNDCDVVKENRGKRLGAGENPAKRDQILDGAIQVFMERGFEGASMNDVTRAAGVSKGTIYVYFQSKEELFMALVERERTRKAETIRNLLDDSLPLEETLYKFGVLLATSMTSYNAMRGMRMALGVVDRMPDTAQCYLREGMGKGPQILKEYIDRQVEKGLLKIDDTMLAARQFADLCLAGLFRPALFGELSQEPRREEIERVVRAAIDMFMNYYGKQGEIQPAS